MTPHDLARALDAVANQLQVVAGLATELRRSRGADDQTLVEREGAVDRVVRRLKRVPPTHAEDA
jgi:hypothetical protein